MQLSLDGVAALLRACAGTGDVELTCDELLEVLAAHVESAGVGPGGERWRELAVGHLRLCASCRQESEALAALVCGDSPEPPRDA